MTDEERNGRLFLGSMFGLWIVAELLLITSSVSREGIMELVTGAGRLILTLGLMYGVMSGRSWAKWVFVSLLIVTLVMAGTFLLQRQQSIMFWLVVYLSVLLYALLISSSVRAYLRAQKQMRRSGRQDATSTASLTTPADNSRVTEGPPSTG